MRIRVNFVSNSSSASFILQKSKMSSLQIYAMLHLPEMIDKLNMSKNDDDGWSIHDDGEFIRGDTIMDNDGMNKFFKAIGLNNNAIVNYESE
jgi:hypothetical protein